MIADGSNSGQQIIEELRQRLQDEAQRKSEKFRMDAALARQSQQKSAIQNVTKRTNIFENLKKPESASLFGGERKSVNLFQMKPASNEAAKVGGSQGAQNIFMMSQKPKVEPSQDDEALSENSNQDVVEQSQNIFRTQPDVKIMKFDYKNETSKLLEIPVKKFKNGVSIAKEEIYITLESYQNQPSSIYLLVRANSTKVIVYQGTLIKNISKPEHFMQKSDTLKFDVVRKAINPSEQAPQAKLTKQVVKVQFSTVEDCDKFTKVVSEYFNIPLQ